MEMLTNDNGCVGNRTFGTREAPMDQKYILALTLILSCLLLSSKKLYKLLSSRTDTGLRTYLRKFMWRSGSKSLKETLYGLYSQL